MPRSLLLGGLAENHPGQDADELTDGEHLHFAHPFGDVALADVGQFVGQDAGHFGFMLHLEDEPREDEDVAGRAGEGVDGVVVDDADVEGEGLGRHDPDQAFDHAGHVVVDLGVLDQRHPGPDQGVEFFAEFPFVLEVKGKQTGLGRGDQDGGDKKPDGGAGGRQSPGRTRPWTEAMGGHGPPIPRSGREGKMAATERSGRRTGLRGAGMTTSWPEGRLPPARIASSKSIWANFEVIY